MFQEGFQQKDSSRAFKREPFAARRRLASLLGGLLAVAVLSALAASPAMAQKSDVGIRGNVQFLYGLWDVSSPNNDPTAEDIDGAMMSTESNIFFEGKNGPADWQFRFRIRGRDRPGDGDGAGNFSADGQAGNVGSGGLQTVRGHLVWHVTDSFAIAGRRDGTHPVATVTENDPIQNLPCACRLGETSDEPYLDFRFTSGAIWVGGMLSASPGTAMQTNGQAARGPGSGGGANGAGDSGSQLIGAYFRYKQRGLMFSAYAASASADADTDDDGTLDFSGSSTAAQAHLILPIGIGALKFDFETVSNDLEPTLNDGETTEDQTFFGVKLEVMGLRAGFASGVQEIGSFEATKSNLTAHYRIGISKGFWVGPEFQLQTIELSGPGTEGTDDEEITSLAFLMSTKF